MLVADSTLRTYQYTAGKFVEWLTKKINSLDEIKAYHVRSFLSQLRDRNLSDNYLHCNARAIKTFLRFLHNENYISEQITFQMPKIAKKRLPILSPSELKQVLNSCDCLRDKAIVMLMVDTGLRRAEACALDWGDVDIKSGLVWVRKGKGGKARLVVIGISTSRTLLKYRKTVIHIRGFPLLQTRSGTRYTPLMDFVRTLSDLAINQAFMLLHISFEGLLQP